MTNNPLIGSYSQLLYTQDSLPFCLLLFHFSWDRTSLCLLVSVSQLLLFGLPLWHSSNRSAGAAGVGVQSLSQEDPLEEGMATHSSIPAQRIPWTEEPGRLQSIRSQRVGLAMTEVTQHACMQWLLFTTLPLLMPFHCSYFFSGVSSPTSLGEKSSLGAVFT